MLILTWLTLAKRRLHSNSGYHFAKNTWVEEVPREITLKGEDPEKVDYPNIFQRNNLPRSQSILREISKIFPFFISKDVIDLNSLIGTFHILVLVRVSRNKGRGKQYITTSEIHLVSTRCHIDISVNSSMVTLVCPEIFQFYDH